MKNSSLVLATLALMSFDVTNAATSSPSTPSATFNLLFDPADGKGIVAPAPQTKVVINEGSTIHLSTTPAISSKWYKDGIEYASTPDGTLQIPNATKLCSGAYMAVATVDQGLIHAGLESHRLSLEVGPVSQMINISSRGRVSNPDSTVIVGFIVKGEPTELKTILIRVVGKSLSKFGVTAPLEDPTGTIFDSKGAAISIWDNYKVKHPTITSAEPDKALVKAASISAGAFEIPDEDDAFVTYGLLSPGLYTIQAKSLSNKEGEVLVEVYEVK